VPWREFFATLKQVNFRGYCCIEREAGTRGGGHSQGA
jgi:sugar phosphate isomerase/epimerase